MRTTGKGNIGLHQECEWDEQAAERLAARPFRERQFTSALMDEVERRIRDGAAGAQSTASRYAQARGADGMGSGEHDVRVRETSKRDASGKPFPAVGEPSPFERSGVESPSSMRMGRGRMRPLYLLLSLIAAIAVTTAVIVPLRRAGNDSDNVSATIGQIVRTAKFTLAIPEAWTARQSDGSGDDWLFSVDGEVVGGVVTDIYYPDQPDSSLYPNHSEIVESDRLDDLAAPVLRTRLIRSAPAAAEVQTSVEELHYYFLIPRKMQVYDLYFTTAGVPDDTALQIAKSLTLGPEMESLQEDPAPTPEATPTSPPGSDEPDVDLTPEQRQAQQVWDEMERRGTFETHPVDERLDGLTYEQVLDGLTNKEPWVRWYCAYRIGEFDDGAAERRDAILAALGRAATDSEELVTTAARFSLALIEGQLDGDDRFAKSPTGGEFAFIKYGQAKFNDGRLWVFGGEKAKVVYAAENAGIFGYGWSPDGRLLGVQYGGQQYTSFAVVNPETGEARDHFGLVNRIIADPANGYEVDPSKAPRFDPYEYLIDWSPDGSRLLFKYEFSDENFNRYEGFGIYHLANDRIEKVYTLPVNESQERPDGFAWD